MLESTAEKSVFRNMKKVCVAKGMLVVCSLYNLKRNNKNDVADAME